MIKINGVPIKEPTNQSLERYNLTKAGRVASGLMTLDLVAKKRKLLISYTVLSGAEMATILDLIDTDEMFFEVQFDDHKGLHTIECYVGAIPSDYFRKTMGWYYKNVEFSLIER